jgi:adenosylcobinamide-phosphate synthase
LARARNVSACDALLTGSGPAAKVSAMVLGWILGADASATLAILALALALDAALGEALFRRLPHPVALIGRAVAALETRLNVQGLDAGASRLRGALAVAAVVGVPTAMGLMLAFLLNAGPLPWLVEAFAVSVLLAGRSLYDHVRAVAVALETGGLDAGRAAVAHIVGRDPQSLDGHGVARAAIESLAENFSDGVVAPAFWYALFGLPGIFAYKAVNTLDSMIGHKTPRYLHFGMAAARLDDAANLIPARLSGLLIALGARWRIGAALKSMFRDARKHRSPNAGWPEAAMAGALGLKLAGPRKYQDETVDAPYIGPGAPDATEADIRRSLELYLNACALVFAAAALGALLA